MIKIGDNLQDIAAKVALFKLTEAGPEKVEAAALFAGKTVVLFAVPGAFTPTCSAQHLPGFEDNAEAIRAKGIDEIMVISVNDPFVMGAWQADSGSKNVTFVSDGNGDFADAIGLTMDGSGFGLGKRSQRYSLVAKDGVVSHLNVEAPGDFSVSSATHLLNQLD